MFIARAKYLKFIGDPNEVPHRVWLIAEGLVEADNKGEGILAEGSMKSVVAETYEEAAQMLCEMVGEALATHWQKFDPNNFRFSVIYTEAKDGRFWKPDTSRDGGDSVPVYKPKEEHRSIRIVVDDKYTYETGQHKVKLGDTVILPPTGWRLRRSNPTPWEGTVTALTSDYAGPVEMILGVK